VPGHSASEVPSAPWASGRTDDAAAPRAQRPGFWAAHHNGELTGFVAALAAVLVTAVLGGFRDGTPPVVDRRAGQAVGLGAWQVTVSGAQLPAPGADRVTVSLQVTNLTRGTRPTGDPSRHPGG